MVKKKALAPCTDDTCDVRVVHLERVARARAEAIAEKALERLALTYKIMGDPTRLKIILALRGGEMCVCDIAAFVGLSESAVSHQLGACGNWPWSVPT
jgi:predicted transcriptional regulator